MICLKSPLYFMFLACLVTVVCCALSTANASSVALRSILRIGRRDVNPSSIFNGTGAQRGYCNSFADIILIVDASESIGLDNFKKVLSFLTDLTASFKIGSDDVKFGLVAFSESAHKMFDLNGTTSDHRALNEAILNTPYYNGSTNTGEALDFIRYNNMFGSESGGRPNATKVVILVTNGRSIRPVATAKSAKKLRKTGAKLFVVGIGSFVNRKELMKIAKNHANVFRPADYDELVFFVDKLVKRTCLELDSIRKKPGIRIRAQTENVDVIKKKGKQQQTVKSSSNVKGK